MKYKEIIARRNIISLVPAVGLDDEARAVLTLNLVAYEKAIADFNKTMEEVREKLKGEGFDEKLDKFHLAINPTEKPSEEQTKQIEELRADPEFEPFRKEHEEWMKSVDAAWKKAVEERDIKIHEYPIMKHLPAISRVLPAGKCYGEGEGAPDNQEIFSAIVDIAYQQK